MSAKNDVATAAELRAQILAEITIEEDCIRAAEVEHRSQLAELTAQAAAIQAEHDRAAALARATYAAVPDMPTMPDGQAHQEALHQLLRARDALRQRRVEALAAALPTVIRGWDVARVGLDVQAREISAAASALAEQYSSWHRLLREARKSFEQPNLTRGRILHGPSTRMRPRPTASDVLLAALGVDLCAPGPSDSDVRAMLVTGRLDDDSGRVIVGG